MMPAMEGPGDAGCGRGACEAGLLAVGGAW